MQHVTTLLFRLPFFPWMLNMTNEWSIFPTYLPTWYAKLANIPEAIQQMHSNNRKTYRHGYGIIQARDKWEIIKNSSLFH
jgi:hypothetical protein